MGDLPESGTVEVVVAYRGAWMCVLQSVCVIVFAGIAVVARSFIGFVLCGALAVFMGALASSHCRRVELHADGALIVRYFVRRPVVTRADAVRSIERDDEDGECTIIFERGKFRLSPNRSARWLVHALVRRNPSIRLSGYSIPPL